MTRRAHVEITLPIPSRDIGGNDRAHPLKRYRERKEAKELARLTARSLMAGMSERTWAQLPWKGAYIDIDWYGWNRPDPDNIAARCKAYVDGIRAAGLIVDDGPNVIQAYRIGTIAIDRSYQRVVITVTKGR